MNLFFKSAFLIVPINLIAVAVIQLELISKKTGPTIREHFDNNTLLVIAHPDDETMFFGPLIVNLVEANKDLTILCLSHGDSDNLGEQRSREMVKVAHELGSRAKLEIITDERLSDGLITEWDADIASEYIHKYLMSTGTKTTVVTFDSYGVSGHPNHNSVYNALEMLRGRLRDLNGRVYHLKSVSMIRKYISFFDALANYLPRLTFGSKSTGEKQITVALNFKQYRRLRKLLALHDSQMVWFRRLYSVFSRYMFINDYILAS